jgi:hypothetical protein
MYVYVDVKLALDVRNVKDLIYTKLFSKISFELLSENKGKLIKQIMIEFYLQLFLLCLAQ